MAEAAGLPGPNDRSIQEELRDLTPASQDEMPSRQVDASVEPTIGGLIRDFHVIAYRFAFRLTGSSADAEDLTQQAFLIAHQRLEQLRDPAKAAGWLLTIVRTCFLKSRRRQRPVDAGSIELDVDAIPERSSDREEVDREALQKGLNSLDDEQRAVVLMFYFEQISYKEIAEQLNVPLGTVMSRLSRAKSKLRGYLLAQQRSDARAETKPDSAALTGSTRWNPT